MSDQPDSPSPSGQRGGWRSKFANAFRGVWESLLGDVTFLVHLPAAVAVIVVAALLRVSLEQWCLLVLCIAIVLAAETANTALEAMAKAVDASYHPQLRKALDAGSGAVLISALGAVAVGMLVFGHRLGTLTGWW